MSFEVFDDVAFYFLIQALLSIFIVIPTLFIVINALCGFCQKKPDVLDISKFQSDTDAEVKQQTSSCRDYFKIRYLVLAAFWVLYIYLWIQLPNYQTEELTTFQPYEILGVDSAATDAELKKAYRKLSLTYHPDKNPDNVEEAERKFLLVSKAYQTLSDPVAKKKFDEFGTPDGFQGASGTIGLPSWLTRKDNELHILLLYFLLLIVLPPICVFIWWRKASNYHAMGARNGTVQTYYYHIREQMAPKFLIEILAASEEYNELDRPTDTEGLLKLWREMKDDMVKMKLVRSKKNMLPSGYVFKGTVLLYAYILKKPIPDAMQGELKIILKEAHRLLDVLCELSISARQFARPAISAVDLMQWLTQATWSADHPLQQLPHFSEKDARACMKKRIGTLEAFRRAPMSKKKKICPAFTDEQWKDIEEVLARFPLANLSYDYGVEDEEGVFEQDFVTINASFERLGTDIEEEVRDKPTKPKPQRKKPKSVTKKTSGGRKMVTKKTSSRKTATKPQKKQVIDEDKEKGKKDKKKKIETDEEVEAREKRLLDDLPTVARVKKKDKSHAPIAHSSFFPFEKREIWYIFLVYSPRKSPQVVGFQKIYNFSEKIKLKIRVGAKGIHEYDLIAKCDSYIGCDIKKSFKIRVEKMSRAEEEQRDRKMTTKFDDDDDEEDDDDDEEAEGKWYYLGCTSAIELVLNVIVLGLFGLFAVQFLQSRGLWQKYFEPVIAVFGRLFSPAWNAVYPKAIEPWFTPLFTVLQTGWDKVAAYFPEPNATQIDPLDL